jgi:protein SERAC1
VRKRASDCVQPFSFYDVHSTQALILSQGNAEEHIKSISSCVRGIIFLGTPLEGSSKAKWADIGQRFAKLVGKDTNQDIVATLQKDSARLRDLRDGFVNFVRSRAEAGAANSKLEVICFFEEFSTTYGMGSSKKAFTLGEPQVLTAIDRPQRICYYPRLPG